MKFYRIFLLAAFLFFMPAFSIVACSDDDKSKDEAAQNDAEIERLVDLVWEFSQSHPDGFTINIQTMEEPKAGMAVSYAATQNSHSREKLPFVIKHALEHDGYVGGWLDTDSNLYYFDSTKLFPEDKRDEAIQFGLDNDQKSIYVISTGESINLDDYRKSDAQ